MAALTYGLGQFSGGNPLTLVLGSVVAPTSHFVYMAARGNATPVHHTTHAPASNAEAGLRPAALPHASCTYAALFAHPLPSLLGTPPSVDTLPKMVAVQLPGRDSWQGGPALALLLARAPPRT